MIAVPLGETILTPAIRPVPAAVDHTMALVALPKTYHRTEREMARGKDMHMQHMTHHHDMDMDMDMEHKYSPTNHDTRQQTSSTMSTNMPSVGNTTAVLP